MTKENAQLTKTPPAELNPVEILEEQRYIRQELLWGQEGQSKLGNARVTIIGLDYQGAYAALCLTALGVGNIILVSGDEAKTGEMFLDMPVDKQKANSYPNLLSRINSRVRFEGYPTNLETRIDQMTLEDSTVIIDATNSIRSKQLAIAYGREKGIPVLSTSSKQGYTKLVLCKPLDNPEDFMPMFEGTQQDPLMALAMAGVISEEVRKLIFNEHEQFLKEPVRYRLGQGYRFGHPKKGEETPQAKPDIYAALKVAFLGGGGGLGNWGTIAASHMGFGAVDMYDYDTYESHNINRQVLAYDGVGKSKALHIAEKMRRMTNGRTKSIGVNTKIEPGFKTEEHYDLIFDFVDNRYTRALNAAFSITQGVPMISAGALPYSARWDSHVSGKTQCMDCLYQIYAEGRKEEMIRRASCAANPDPSVVMSNAIAAVNAVLETYTLFEPEIFGEPFNGEQTFRAASPKRFGTSPLNLPCDCYSRPVPDLMISQQDVEKFATENIDLIKRGG